MTLVMGACSPRELTIVVPNVPQEGAKAIIYGYETAGRLFELTATDASERAFELDLRSAEETEAPPIVWAMPYESTLPELGLGAGPLPRDPEGQPLPRPPRALRTEARIDPPAWQTSDPPESLAGYPVRTEPRCARFEVQNYNLESFDDTVAVLADGDDAAWIVTRDRHVHHLGPSGLERLADLTFVDPPSWGQKRGADLWLSDDSGRLHRGDFERGFVEVARSPHPNTGWFALSPIEQPFELMTASYQGALATWDGAAWIDVLDPAGVDWPWGGVAWVEPGHFLATGAASVLRYRNHRLISDVPAEARESFSTVKHLGPANLMLGGLDAIFRHDGTKWERVGRSAVFRPQAFAAHRDGFIVAGSPSAMSLYDPARGFCDLPPVQSTPRMLTEVDGGYFIGFFKRGDPALTPTDPTPVAWMTSPP